MPRWLKRPEVAINCCNVGLNTQNSVTYYARKWIFEVQGSGRRIEELIKREEKYQNIYVIMKELLPCLLRVGDNVKKYRYLLLEKDQVTIGRSPEVTHCLLSVMISRCHAILKKQEEGKWTITDNKSLNGVFVNGNKLEAGKPKILSQGDLVQLGIPAKQGEKAEFIFQFYERLKVKRTRKDSPEEGGSSKKKLRAQPTTTDLTKSKDGEVRVQPSSSKQDTPSGSPYKSYKTKLESYQQEQAAAMQEFQTQLAEMQRKLQQKESEQQQMREQLQQEKQQRESQAAALDQLKLKEQQMQTELQAKQEKMEKEKAAMEKKMQEELSAKLKEREKQLTEYLLNQRTSLMDEKQRVEMCLQQEMEKALEEKDKQLEEQLIKQKEQLESVITEKELKQKMLETQLQATEADKEKQKESTLKAMEDVLANFTDLMETELQCSICNELFVQATSLNCSHAFCAMCINQWLERKNDCPVCRAEVTSRVRSIVLDSYIDKMVEHLSDDLKQNRAELVKIRKEEQTKWDETHKTEGKPGGAGRRGRAILIDSDTDSEVEDESDVESIASSESEEGDDGAYYGGYGRCYSCDFCKHVLRNEKRAQSVPEVEEATGQTDVPTVDE